MGPERAAVAADGLLGQGCRALLSFGYCGALDPGLTPGRLILPERVVDAASGEVVETDPRWREALAARLGLGGAETRVRTLVGSTRVLCAEDKRSWNLRWPEAAIDMESYAVARRAREGGVPCAVLRVVLDRRDDDLPSSLTGLLNPWGRWDAPWFRRLAGVLDVAPRRLIALARARRLAFGALVETARALAPDFLAPEISG